MDIRFNKNNGYYELNIPEENYEKSFIEAWKNNFPNPIFKSKNPAQILSEQGFIETLEDFERLFIMAQRVGANQQRFYELIWEAVAIARLTNEPIDCYKLFKGERL